jgi:hypothetical protein
VVNATTYNTDIVVERNHADDNEMAVDYDEDLD